MEDPVIDSALFETRGRPLDPESLLRFQQRLGVTIPPDYEKFMRAGDGGQFSQPNDLEGSFHGGFREIFPIAESQAAVQTLDHILRVYEDRVPQDFLPIGNDLAGNLLCIALSGANPGAVFFWDHELEADEGEHPTGENLEMLAPTLHEFFKRLTVG